jgi:proline dehydrogenase
VRSALLAASRSPRIRKIVEANPLVRPVVSRFIPGTTADDALAVTNSLREQGIMVTIDHLGEDITDLGQANETVEAYVRLLKLLDGNPIDVSVKLSAIGQTLPDGERIALDNARRISEVAASVGATVTIDMEDHTLTDRTLDIVRELRKDFPSTGAVLQAYLKRTEQDCRELATEGSRIRLCKGAYKEPESVAYQGKPDVDASYVRCLKILMDGQGYPMVATHDPRLIPIAKELAAQAGRATADYEFQMLYGINPVLERHFQANHDQLRLYLPYGTEWYGYFMRRLAERPANLMFFLRSLASR